MTSNQSINQPAGRIENVLTIEAQATVRRNRSILISIAKCIKFCARQGIALRGHRDDSTSPALNQGNFRALIAFRAETDAVLASHPKTVDKNATFVSKTLQIRSLVFLKLYPQIEKNAYLRIAIFKISRGSMPPG